MTAKQEHEACVDAWLARAVHPDEHDQNVDAFEAALGALTRRARKALGEITLAAVVDRVLVYAAEEFPAFASLRAEPNGDVSCAELHRAPASADLALGFRYVLVELLTVLGHLAAEILTPALHAELVRLPERRADENESS